MSKKAIRQKPLTFNIEYKYNVSYITYLICGKNMKYCNVQCIGNHRSTWNKTLAKWMGLSVGKDAGGLGVAFDLAVEALQPFERRRRQRQKRGRVRHIRGLAWRLAH